MKVYLTRDAANRRNLGSAKYHAAREMEHWNGLVEWVTACGGLAYASDSAREAGEVPEKNRCRTAACRGAWMDGGS